MYKIYGKRTLMLLLSGALLIALFSFTGCAANLDNTAETTASHAPSATVAVTPVQAVAAAAPVHQTTNFKITLDVNPSIELTVTNGVISGVTAYNDDAQALLLGVDVSGLSADDAVKTLVNALNKDGYLNNGETKPYLIITVNDPSKSTGKLAEALKKDAKEALKQLSVKCNVRTAGVSPEIASAAQKLGISSGRYLLLAHISGKENITIEEALAKYGSMKIAELMHLHEDNEDIFDDKSEDQEDEDLAKELTPEQLSKLEAARSQYAAAVHAAESAYYAALTQAKQNFKSQWASAKSQYSEDKAALLAALKSVKAEFKAARNAARGILKQAITTAQAAFKSTVPGLGLSDGQLEDILDYKVDDHIELPDYSVDEKGKDKSEDIGDKDNKDNKDNEDVKNNKGKDGKDDKHDEGINDNKAKDGKGDKHDEDIGDNHKKDDDNGSDKKSGKSKGRQEREDNQDDDNGGQED